MAKLGGAVSLAEVIRDIVDDRLADVHTALPCRVVSFDAATQTVTVKPLLSTSTEEADGTMVARSIPEIHRVPVAFINGSGFYVTVPLTAGDLGFCLFSERSIERWKAGGGSEVEPDDVRTFHLNDAIFIPAVRPRGGPLPSVPSNAMKVGNGEGAHIRIEAGGSADATQPVACVGSVTTGHVHGPGTMMAGPSPVVGVTASATDTIATGVQQIKVPGAS